MIHAAMFLALCSAQPETATPMERAIHEYFDGEIERGASLGMAMGVSSLIAAPLLLFATDSEFLEGAAYPIAVVGILEIIVASVIYWRTSDQKRALLEQVQRDPHAYKKEETERMARVNSGFGIYKWVELGIIVAGLGTGITGAVIDEPLVTGIGFGAVFQGLFALMIDLMAEGRAEDYTAAIESFTP